MKTDKSTIAAMYQDKILAEQLRSIYMRFTPALVGTSLGALFMVALQWPIIDHEHLIYWLVLFSVMTVFRGLQVYLYVKQKPDDQSSMRWVPGFTISTVLAGLVWALGVYIAFPENNLSSQLTLALIVIGLSAGATSTISNLLSSFIFFVLPMMITLMVKFFLEDSYETNIVVAVVFFTLIFLLRGAIHIYRSNLHNITLRIEAEARESELLVARNEAIKSSHAKSEFLANMSHELRTPLHGILSYAQFGCKRMGSLSEEKIAKYFSQISLSGERLKVLLDDLLDLSKLEAGKMLLNIEESDLHEIIEGCTSEQEALLESKKLKVKCNFDTDLTRVECDRNRIGQVIMNILSNAIKFSPVAGTILISARNVALSESDENPLAAVDISIADQGPGVPTQEREIIFRKFLQGSKSNHAMEGTGLGLAISQELIHSHHGRIWCDNGELGGAEFHFVIPVKYINKTPG